MLYQKALYCKKLTLSVYSNGGLAQMVERPLSMREVRGSMPRFSIYKNFFLKKKGKRREWKKSFGKKKKRKKSRTTSILCFLLLLRLAVKSSSKTTTAHCTILYITFFIVFFYFSIWSVVKLETACCCKACQCKKPVHTDEKIDCYTYPYAPPEKLR